MQLEYLSESLPHGGEAEQVDDEPANGGIDEYNQGEDVIL